MKRVCAWCGKFLGWGRYITPDKTSHGMCEACRAIVLAEAETFNKSVEAQALRGKSIFADALNIPDAKEASR